MTVQKKFNHLDYYIKNKISPVRQNIKKKISHFERRDSLYKYLGITKKFINKSEILEVGPAEGHNAAYLASCDPKKLDLVEANPSAFKNIKKVFKSFKVSTKKLTVFKKKFEDFKSSKKYDLVICEAWLGISKNEVELINKLGNYVKKDGIIIITASNSVAFLSNIIRRFVACNLTNENMNFKKKSFYLSKLFGSHLKTLKNMSCPHIDWVQDSLLGDGFLNIHPSPNVIFNKLGKKFNFYASYPVFLNEWRWYKDLIGRNFDNKKKFLIAYKKNIVNFLDYKHNFNNITIKSNLNLLKKCDLILINLIKYEQKKSNKNFNNFIKVLESINQILIKNKINLKGFMLAAKYLKNKKYLKFRNLDYFKKYFGRELLYLSCVKEK